MTLSPTEKAGAAHLFHSTMTGDPNISTGLAAIKTLLAHLNKSKATTVTELQNELEGVQMALEGTDYSSTSIRSASNLFRRFISLAPGDLIDQPEFENILGFYKQRGEHFIERVDKSRSIICNYSKPLLQDGLRVLTHSYSKVVLECLIKRSKSDVNIEVPSFILYNTELIKSANQYKSFSVFVTESQPDASGKRMHKELEAAGISSTLILDSAVGYMMENVDIVMVGAEGVMETGGIINKIGTLNIALCAKMMNKPVYVMVESIKFIKEYPLNQADIPEEFKYKTSTRKEKNLLVEHPLVDYTPPTYITLLFTDLGVLPPAAVGEELIKLYT